jgi:hypothetical protein
MQFLGFAPPIAKHVPNLCLCLFFTFVCKRARLGALNEKTARRPHVRVDCLDNLALFLSIQSRQVVMLMAIHETMKSLIPRTPRVGGASSEYDIVRARVFNEIIVADD